jgi:3-hydroxyisobutyrate dehydrogenase-like beta-hydroxyacid dehydrogenase
MEIGMIGLGLLGRALVKRFLGSGCGVMGYDISPDACRLAGGIGAEIRASAQDVSDRCDVILLSLPDSGHRQELFWGEAALGEKLLPGRLVLDTTTGSPKELESDAERLAAREVRLVDVCILGSSEEVVADQAAALVGARKDEPEVSTIVGHFASRAFYFGHPSAASAAKLVGNLVLGLNRLVLAEGLALCRKVGLDEDTMLAALQAGGAYSRAMDNKGGRMIGDAFEDPVARLAQHAKDVGLIGDLAREVDALAPLTEVHAELLQSALERGLGGLDNSAIITMFR